MTPDPPEPTGNPPRPTPGSAEPASDSTAATPPALTPALTPDQALRRAGPRACLSHESAARALGIELLKPGSERLTVPRSRSRLILPGWRVVRGDVPSPDLMLVDGLRCTDAERTVLDLSRTLPLDEAVVAADSSLRLRLALVEALTVRLHSALGRRAAGPRAVAGLLDPLAESVLETCLRLVLHRAGLRPLTQQVIRDRADGFVARVDFCWPAERLVVEADGFAFHSDRAAFRADRDRLNALERLGWRVLRFTWEDVRGRPEYVVQLVRDCLEAVAA